MSFKTWAEVCPMGDLLIRSANLHPERKAFVMPELELTYTQLRNSAVEVARGIVGLGVPERAHIGILANNSKELVSVIFGALLANCIAVPIHARHKARELGYIIENADLSLLLTTAADTTHVDFRQTLSSALPNLSDADSEEKLSLPEAPKLKHVVLLEGDEAPGFLSRSSFYRKAADVSLETIDERRLRTRLRDIAFIVYTSGTTANPKGCLLTHEAMTRGPVYRADQRFRSKQHDVTWGGGPLFHIGSLAPFTGVIGTAGTYLTDTVFEPGRALDLMERERVTAAWPWFPAILQPILDHPEFSPERLSDLRKVLLIGPPPLLRRVQNLFPETEFMQACGMTETAGIFGLCGPDETPEERATSQGKAVPGVEVKIVTAETGQEAPPDTVGEILVRGYCVMEGYYRSPEKTAEALDEGGWLHTGDLYAMTKDGRLTFNGRAKDMLKVGGENVAAIEIESFLCSHPAVKIAEVVGRKDDRMDEVPVAFVELRPGKDVSPDELIDFCKNKIAGYKIPRDIFFMNADEWPMSATKVNKVKLRAIVAENS